MAKIKFLLFYFGLLVFSIFVIVQLYPQIHPYAGIHLPLTKEKIENRVYEISRELGLDTQGLSVEVIFTRNTALLRQLQTELGLKTANEELRDGAPGYYWEIYWIPEQKNFFASFNPGQVEGETIVPLAEQEWRMNIGGRLLQLQENIADNAPLPQLSQAEAREIVGKFLARYTDFYDVPQTIPAQDSTHQDWETTAVAKNAIPLHFQNSKSIQLPNRVDYEFSWRALAPYTGDTIRVQVKISGNEVSAFSVKYDVPNMYSSESSNPVTQILSPLLMFTIAGITIVLAFKRWRAYELSFSIAIPLGIFLALIFGIFLYQSLPPNMGIGLVLAMIFAPLILGGSFIFVWAVGESIGRETWNDKFISFDLLRNRYYLHSYIGKALIRGIAIGGAGLALWLILIRLTEAFSAPTIISQDVNYLRYVEAANPLLFIFSLHLFSSIYIVAAYFVLMLSLLRRRISSPVILLPLLAIFLALAYQSSIQPLMVGGPIEAGVMVIIIWSFYRFDLIAGFTAIFTATVMEPGISLFLTGTAEHLYSGYFLLALYTLAMIYAAVTIFTKDRIFDFQRIAPVYVKNITERQRLQRELEIAREVQMSFLPKKNPRISRLDIASRCEPAREVGGDYYDFIELPGNRLGIVIGDVSGKGTQAAFYMTLTKGFLRALANISDSPAVVLTHLNRLFYDNVKRGVFISMVYGIFDVDEGVLRLARAGHNPVIMRKTIKQALEMIHSRGLALGMEKGNTFEHIIQEVKTPFQNHDLFVFYTDGFTEAMNKDKQEFGDERFAKAIEKYSAGTAEQLMEGVFKEVRQFTGRTLQHDDMTIVVVKISEKALEEH